MKTKELKDLRSKEFKEIEVLLVKKRLDLIRLQAKILSGKEKNLKSAKVIKKDIARILTIVKEKKEKI